MNKFAIRDEATGEWLHFGEEDWKKIPNGDLVTAPDYHSACGVLSDSKTCRWHRPNARIVPAPPAEMTDAEARTWFRTQGCRFSINPAHGDENEQYFFKDTLTMLPAPHGKNGVAYGATIEDAIRAGRKALESK